MRQGESSKACIQSISNCCLGHSYIFLREHAHISLILYVLQPHNVTMYEAKFYLALPFPPAVGITERLPSAIVLTLLFSDFSCFSPPLSLPSRVTFVCCLVHYVS